MTLSYSFAALNVSPLDARLIQVVLAEHDFPTEEDCQTATAKLLTLAAGTDGKDREDWREAALLGMIRVGMVGALRLAVKHGAAPKLGLIADQIESAPDLDTALHLVNVVLNVPTSVPPALRPKAEVDAAVAADPARFALTTALLDVIYAAYAAHPHKPSLAVTP